MKKFLLWFLLIMLLSSCANIPLFPNETQGRIIGKVHTPEQTYMRLHPMMINGKIHLQPVYDRRLESFTITISVNINRENRTVKYSVNKKLYEELDIGDLLEYNAKDGTWERIE